MLSALRSSFHGSLCRILPSLTGADWSVLCGPITNCQRLCGTRDYSAKPGHGAASDDEKQSSVYIYNVEGTRNNSPVLLGLMDYFERFIPRIGYFQVWWLSVPLRVMFRLSKLGLS